ncbi:Protein of uncharacterised function (DUF2699) [Acinetobacter baumannii]|nr:Protein of uncharacterised function (DUF2699) [Acinetobacter baumannii]
MEQHLLWLAALFVGHVQGLDHQFGIRLGRERPADHPPGMQIQHRGQVVPTALRPDVGDVATPHLIGMLGREFAVQPIRDIRPLNRGLFVGVRARLLADQAQLTHQPTHSETADGHALFAQHAQNAAAAGRAPTLAEQLVDLAA